MSSSIFIVQFHSLDGPQTIACKIIDNLPIHPGPYNELKDACKIYNRNMYIIQKYIKESFTTDNYIISIKNALYATERAMKSHNNVIQLLNKYSVSYYDKNYTDKYDESNKYPHLWVRVRCREIILIIRNIMDDLQCITNCLNIALSYTHNIYNIVRMLVTAYYIINSIIKCTDDIYIRAFFLFSYYDLTEICNEAIKNLNDLHAACDKIIGKEVSHLVQEYCI